jgi:hypothetical protein
MGVEKRRNKKVPHIPLSLTGILIKGNHSSTHISYYMSCLDHTIFDRCLILMPLPAIIMK